MAAAKTVKGPKSDKLLRDALLIAINREEEFEGQKMKRFARIAEQLAKAACTGDLQATREVWDRVEGKPTQAIEHSGEIETSNVARVPMTFDTPDEWQAHHKPTTVQ